MKKDIVGGIIPVKQYTGHRSHHGMIRKSGRASRNNVDGKTDSEPQIIRTRGGRYRAGMPGWSGVRDTRVERSSNDGTNPAVELDPNILPTELRKTYKDLRKAGFTCLITEDGRIVFESLEMVNWQEVNLPRKRVKECILGLKDAIAIAERTEQGSHAKHRTKKRNTKRDAKSGMQLGDFEEDEIDEIALEEQAIVLEYREFQGMTYAMERDRESNMLAWGAGVDSTKKAEIEQRRASCRDWIEDQKADKIRAEVVARINRRISEIIFNVAPNESMLPRHSDDEGEKTTARSGPLKGRRGRSTVKARLAEVVELYNS
ncbi:TPA: hypothetical protein DCW56_05640 [Candidatus Peregrinibacteria bacterium]|nr:hypothetical protein [Candidatus Peregrinibacteria bacterium]